jgi:hypothetical protein
MRFFVVVTVAGLLFAACSSKSPENSGPSGSVTTEGGAERGTGTGTNPGPDAGEATDDGSSSAEGSPSAEASQPVEDAMTSNPDDAAMGMDADETGLTDSASGGEASTEDAEATGDAGKYGPNWKLVCPNTMPPMTCCTVYCNCMGQRCATEIMGGFPGGKTCMSWCLDVGPTLKRGPLSTGIQFLVCECSEAGNPAVPFDWHSHCGHALGMNGGTCKY